MFWRYCGGVVIIFWDSFVLERQGSERRPLGQAPQLHLWILWAVEMPLFRVLISPGLQGPKAGMAAVSLWNFQLLLGPGLRGQTENEEACLCMPGTLHAPATWHWKNRRVLFGHWRMECRCFSISTILCTWFVISFAILISLGMPQPRRLIANQRTRKRPCRRKRMKRNKDLICIYTVYCSSLPNSARLHIQSGCWCQLMSTSQPTSIMSVLWL